MKHVGVEDQIQKYIMYGLETRASYQTGQLDCGVAQGDSLSMFLFAAGIDKVLRELHEKYPMMAFADDVLLKILHGQDPITAIREAKQMFT